MADAAVDSLGERRYGQATLQEWELAEGIRVQLRDLVPSVHHMHAVTISVVIPGLGHKSAVSGSEPAAAIQYAA